MKAIRAIDDSWSALHHRMRASASCRFSLIILLSAWIAIAQAGGQRDFGASDVDPIHAASAHGKKAYYPNPSNYKEFSYHALVIGIDITPVNGSGSTCHVPFAAQLGAFLKGWRCFSKGSVTVLKGAEGTKLKIDKAIAELHLGSKDVLLIYYGGHGDRAGIVTSDHQRLSPAELAGHMRRSGAGFKVLLVSGCYSGIFVRPGEDGRDFQRAGFAVVSSGEEGGTSTYTSKGIGFGPYLWKLLNRKRRDSHGVITLGEFTDFIRRQNVYWGKHGDYRLSDGRNFGPEDSVIFWN